jgi:hypothetical protein
LEKKKTVTVSGPPDWGGRSPSPRQLFLANEPSVEASYCTL